jgi:hypothetical protein
VGWFGRIAVTLIIVALGGCAASEREDELGDPPKAKGGVGCTQILAVGEGATCLVEWACADAGSQSLVCEPRDGGVACGCTLNEEPATEVVGPATGCGTQPFEQAGKAICGWSFE